MCNLWGNWSFDTTEDIGISNSLNKVNIRNSGSVLCTSERKKVQTFPGAIAKVGHVQLDNTSSEL